MDGMHDLGGRLGFGPVDRLEDAVFRAPWERRAMGMTFVGFMRGLSNGGQFRHSIERMDAVHYLSSAYYEHWTTAMATRLVETGVLDRTALEAETGGPFALSRPEHPQAADEARQLPEPGPPLAVGDRVRVTAGPRVGHTRCPAYVRDRCGHVVRIDRPASLADLEAHIDARRQETSYCVAFDAGELWGAAAEPATVHVDLAASYLAEA